MKQPRIAIIGGGITGLTVAYYLNKNGLDVTVFEQNDRPGGVIHSFNRDGFVYEYGPNTGTLSNIETVRLLLDELAGDVEIQVPDERAKKRLIWKSGRWHALPTGPVGGLLTPLFTWKDKIRLLAEPFRKPGTDPMESVAGMVIRRMGRSYLDYAVDPFISGIYAGDPDYLVTRYALPKLYALEQEYGSFIGGAMKKAKIPKTDDERRVTKEIFSARGGLEAIIRALAGRVGEGRIRLHTQARVQKRPGGYLVNGEPFEVVVSTAGAYALPEIFGFLATEDLAPVTQLRYAGVVEIALGFKQWTGMDLNAFGGLVPTVENKNILGILFMSTLFEGRAPKGGALLTTFVGGIKKPHLLGMSRDELMALLEPEWRQLLGLKDFRPDLIEMFYHPRAIAQYGPDSPARLQAIERIQTENPSLYLAGSIRDGIGMADRIKQASHLVEEITLNLKFEN